MHGVVRIKVMKGKIMLNELLQVQEGTDLSL